MGAAATGLVFAGLAEFHVATRLWSAAGWGVKVALPDDRLLALGAEHLALSMGSLAAAALAAVSLGVLVTRPWAGRDLRGAIDTLGTISQAVPPVVVVAVTLPVFGFGPGPTMIALFAYGLLPILRGTVAAIESVPSEARDAAEALGFTSAQTLWRVELPLAAPLIAASLRIALVLVIATASVGALAGAATLGTPIVAGLQNQNEIELLQGAAATAALAFLADGAALALLGLLERPSPA